MHKPNFPLRPIISSIGTHCYKVAKFFVPLLRPFSTNPLTITDAFSFVKELLNLPFNTNNVVMASFDIKSLFTNIPLDETIDIIVTSVRRLCNHLVLYVCMCVRVCVCVFVCEHDNSKDNKHLDVKFCTYICHCLRKNWLNFGAICLRFEREIHELKLLALFFSNMNA